MEDSTLSSKRNQLSDHTSTARCSQSLIPTLEVASGNEATASMCGGCVSMSTQLITDLQLSVEKL